jgi:hypothetical protein
MGETTCAGCNREGLANNIGVTRRKFVADTGRYWCTDCFWSLKEECFRTPSPAHLEGSSLVVYDWVVVFAWSYWEVG